LKELARGIVGDLATDVSINVEWRRRLFHSRPGQRFEVLRHHEHGLRFSAFFDGWTPGELWVIGVESMDFPDVVTYTFNAFAFL